MIYRKGNDKLNYFQIYPRISSGINLEIDGKNFKGLNQSAIVVLLAHELEDNSGSKI